ncbi:MAG: VIT and vWA domain-containing protein, partial [Isosphaeraceae bacterium]
MKRLRALGAGLAAAYLAIGWLSTTAWSQGFVIDRRPRVPVAQSFEIREVSIVGRVRDQVAEVQVSQTFHNPSSTMVESEFLFPMPEEGAVQDFVLLVDGRELPGRILAKDEARRIYEEIVRVKRDPALLEYMGRGLYRTSVFPIPPGADRKVTMRFTQLCKRDRDVVEFTYPLSTQKFTAKPIQRLSVELSIRSKEPIKSVYCPTDDASIRRFDDHEVDVKLERRDVIPEHDFRLVTTLAEGRFSASLLSYRPSESEDGYFLVLASPEVKRPDERPLPKTVIFVIDRSGSMAGKKIEQARRTLKSVLNNLREDDLFNVVAYDDRVESFQPELQRYNTRSREEAQRFVDNIREGGSTNINDALQTALKMIHDRSRPGYILFLTDGLPTAGEINEMRIAANCRHANEKHARVFCFGVGYDVNARLLDRLSGGNSGTSEYVKPDEDIEAHVGRFYAKMTSPVLTDIHLELSGVDINRTYPRDLPDLFEGGQLVVAGRYRQSGKTAIRVNGRVGEERRTFEFPADLAGTDRGSGHDFVERLWAVRRVGDLIDQIDMNGQNRELVEELVDLSRKYGLMTPYTSFLADENVPLHANAENQRRAGMMLGELRQADGQSAVSQRAIKQGFLQANRVPGMVSASSLA